MNAGDIRRTLERRAAGICQQHIERGIAIAAAVAGVAAIVAIILGTGGTR